jgi:hypothetical protein
MDLHLRPNRSRPLPQRLLHRAAVGAGLARLAIRQRTLRPQLIGGRGRNVFSRMAHRA